MRTRILLTITFIFLLILLTVTTSRNSGLKLELTELKDELSIKDSINNKLEGDIVLFIQLSDIYEGMLNEIDLTNNPNTVAVWGMLLSKKYEELKEEGY